MLSALQLILLAVAFNVATGNPPADVPCAIPNEPTEEGVCTDPWDCGAFQEINRAADLGNTSRLSFIWALQCPEEDGDGDQEDRVCCPRNNGSYRFPYLSTDVTPRIRFDIRSRTDGFLRTSDDIDDECGIDSYDYRIRGKIAGIDEFPWAALLLYKKKFPGCGGVLISRNYVLSAAHCLTGPEYNKYGPLEFVRLREYNLLEEIDCLVVKESLDCINEGKLDLRPLRIVTHPDYEADSFQQHHDIGLVEISLEEDYSYFLRPICLPQAGWRYGKIMTVCGWGRTDLFKADRGEIASPIKMKAAIPFVGHQKCSEAYQQQNLQLISGQICAGGRMRDSCAGDSGSPLMFYDNRQAAWVLTGIVSRGTAACGMLDKPGIYSNVLEYLPWIKGITEL